MPCLYLENLNNGYFLVYVEVKVENKNEEDNFNS